MFPCFSADGNYEVRYKSNVLIYPDGEVLWIPPAIYQVREDRKGGRRKEDRMKGELGKEGRRKKGRRK